jgi:rhodanese-related sulfurtransferase
VGYQASQGLDAVNLEGGMMDWAEAGRPLVGETDAPPRIV